MSAPDTALANVQQPPVDETMQMLQNNGATMSQPSPQKPQGTVKGGLKAVLGGMLSRFASGMGEAMMRDAGIATPQQKAMQMAQIANTNADTAHKMAQVQSMQDKIPVDIGGGQIIYLPQAVAMPILKQRLANEGAAKSKRFLTTPNGLYDTQTKDANGFPTLIPGSGQGIAITPEIAEQYGLPKEFVGKNAKITDLAAAERGNAMQNGFVMGANGPVAANKVTGVGKPVTVDGKPVGNPQVAAADARARAAAKYGIAITDEGETVSRLDALTQGLRLASGNPLLKEGLKGYEDAFAADARMKQMQQQAKDVTGASDMALLFNHIAMTGGNVKGMRMGEKLTADHMKARGIPEELGVMYNHAIDGESLSPEQRTNFLNLAKEVRGTTWQKAAQQGKAFGVNPAAIEQDPDLPPVDLSNYASKVVPKAVTSKISAGKKQVIKVSAEDLK